MFSGIVKTTGKIKKIEKKNKKVYFTIKTNNFLNNIKIGASIACDGVCLTVVKKTKNSFQAELMPETLRITKFSNSKIGDFINLEKSLRVGDFVDGHFVMGHIDGIGKIQKIILDKEYVNLIIKIPKGLKKFLAYKGSVSINGVSLTISGVGNNWFKVSLITHTLEITNLSCLKINDKVNIEIDMVARYLEKLKISL
ncbi:MAG: riboflavin synthase [Patescibacteria group bacterium]|nr:riboflavin synthase [Patescibacteria group bacterium]